MHSESELSGTEEEAAGEPVAIVGIAALYPQAQGVDSFWQLLGETGPRPAGRDGPGLDDIRIDVSRFRIPPAQARSMARMQLLMLEAARQCLEDTGSARDAIPADRTDVVVGTCFGLDRQYANALRVETSRYARDLERTAGAAEDGTTRENAGQAAEELRSLMQQRLGCSPHDRVGEMASTIPARIAGAFKLRGRTLALESADATSFLGIAHAVTSLREGASDAVLVVAGQREESSLLGDALAAKGLAGGPAGEPAGSGGPALGEGVGALLLKRLSSAERDGDRIYATILDCRLRHEGRPGPFGYSDSAVHCRETAVLAHRAAAAPASSVQYLECSGGAASESGSAGPAALSEVFADTRRDAGTGTGTGDDAGTGAGPVPGPVALGSVTDRLGHTFANAGLASVTKMALALHHRRMPPGLAPEASPRPSPGRDDSPFRVADTLESWPAPGPSRPRRAAVSGASLTGTLCHLILEEHTPARTGTAPDRPTAPDKADPTAAPSPAAAATRGPEPIAVVALGGRFADSPDAGSFWQTVLSGRDRIAPLPDSVLDRELYYAPGMLSLDRSYTDHGAPVDVPAEPPPGAAGITPARYAAMDPAQRLALAVADELFAGRADGSAALRGPGLVALGSNLGLSRERRAGAQRSLGEVEEAVGGLTALKHLSPAELAALLAQVRERYGVLEDLLSPALLDGCLASGSAALIAGAYGLDAVPLAVEAACASSLAALDVAIGALRAGSVDYAIAGGVELPCNARDLILCSSLGLLSHDRITPFDTAADGFTAGDGCALFLLKRLSDARRDGDRVLGLLRGIGASNDAKSLIAPDVDGQVRAMRQAFGQVGFDPAEVDYLEAHGTGTKVGDRVEIAATAEVYGGPRRTRALEIGSVKSFFGHTFAAAGSAGLLGALQAMRAGTLPPNANLSTLNPALDLPAVPANVSTRAAPWPSVPDRPRRAGVSSFGTGGINYHLLIEEDVEDQMAHRPGADEHPDGPR